MKVQDILISAFTAATVAVGATFLIDANKNQSDKHQSYSVEDMFTTLDFRGEFSCVSGEITNRSYENKDTLKITTSDGKQITCYDERSGYVTISND